MNCALQVELNKNLGHIYWMLSLLYQMQHLINMVCSNQTSQNIKTFALEEQVSTAVEEHTVNLKDELNVNLNLDNRLPSIVQGDLKMLKLAVCTLVQFGLKYCD